MKNTDELNYSKTTTINLSTHYATKAAQNLLELMEKPHCMEGYIQGSKQPQGLVKLRITGQFTESLKARLKYFFQLDNSYDSISAFGEALCLIQKRAGFPVFESMKVQAISSQVFLLQIPCVEATIFTPIVEFLLNIFNQNLACDKNNLDAVEEFLRRIGQYAPKGSNSLRFLQAAADNDIPWTFIEQNTWQFGYGSRSRWFDSSFTDETSILSTNLARNKVSTARLLAKAGLPVPEQTLAQSEKEAVQAAEKMGYPLVLKPLDSDGGLGVFAGLRTETGLKKAWEFLQGFSKTVLIEKQIPGKDYRLQILNGELVWAVERIPASIVGDGQSDIKTLINAKSIEITNALTLFLSEQNYTLDHVLEQNSKISIQGIANISAGGTPVAVFDKVHPDNKRLAETAANLLRLDIAGVDLIMPNIEKSWLETGAALIEVNAQPQLGVITSPHIYKEILLKLMPDKGRIPIIVLYGNMQAPFIQAIQKLFFSQCKRIGLAKADGAFLNNKKIASTTSAFRAGKSLLFNPQVDALIYHLENLEEIKLQGLPFDACNQVFLLNLCLDESSEALTLLKACKGRVVEGSELLG